MAFNLNIRDLVEEAYERVGVEARSGYQYRTAIRSLNLLLTEWANRGVNLWTVEEGAITTAAGTSSYTLPTTIIDVIAMVRREGSGTSQSDLPLSRTSVVQYAQVPNKLTQAKPLQYWVKRAVDAPVVTLWPTPDAVYTVPYWALSRMDSVASDSGVNPDMPFRFLPALAAGLAYYLAMKTVGQEARIGLLKSVYDDEFNHASQEDREKASLMIVPARGA